MSTAVFPDTTTWQQAVHRVSEVAAEHVADTDADASFPTHALAEMRASGLLGLLVPVEYGGLGGTLDDLIDASIALGRVDMSMAMIAAMHCQQTLAVVRHATEPLRATVLRDIAAGRCYLASVTTEGGSGGHLLSAGAALGTDADRLTVDRFAPIVTGGAYADAFLITMREAEDSAENRVSLVYARRDQLTIDQSGQWNPLGMRASHSVALRMRGAVPREQVIGEPGEFRTIAGTVFGPLAHLGWSACWLGTAAGALQRVLALLRSPEGRKKFDLHSELLLTRLARIRQHLDTVHALLRHTAAVFSAAPDPSVPTVQLLLNTLKVSAAEQCHAAVDDLIEAVGLRHGYLKDSPTGLERALRDLRSASLNYSNDRLNLANGRQALLDHEVHLV
jgi:acyl-CoA dehydrogenase